MPIISEQKPEIAKRKEIIAQNLFALQARIKDACLRSTRTENTIKLVVAVKTVDASTVRALYELGISEIGENKVQDAEDKEKALSDLNIHWHMFGHLQRNKVKRALSLFELIHSVESVRLAEEISKESIKQGKRTDILVEANISGESTKFGIKEAEAIPFIKQISHLEGIRILGLMTMAPIVDDPELCRSVFRGLKELSDKITAEGIKNVEMKYLSMGMTQDFEVAIEEGANLIRVGTAIFKGI
ncbi:MAG TPA: YggS family pyridoxal phosphate-dependent enzyme [Candidatus Brocadiia bacterium]|nr:YggS family pyridoxal phosphate-dependent enzyme [Candidatus Brocadiales bacterium]